MFVNSEVYRMNIICFMLGCLLCQQDRRYQNNTTLQSIYTYLYLAYIFNCNTTLNEYLFNDTIKYTHKYHQFILCTDMSSGMIYCAMVRHFRVRGPLVLLLARVSAGYWSRRPYHCRIRHTIHRIYVSGHRMVHATCYDGIAPRIPHNLR